MPTGVFERTPELRARIGATLRGQSKSPEHCTAISAARKTSPAAAAQLARLLMDPVIRMKRGTSLRMSLKAIAQREMLNHDPTIMARRRESLRTSPKAKAHNQVVGAMGRAAARQAHPTGIECILREFLLPTLLPGRRILSEHRIKCPADFRNQLMYQVDAYVPALRLVVEADGDYWHGLHDVRVRDYYKDEFLRTDGFTVVHFMGNELNAWVGGRDPGSEFWRKIDILLAVVREEE